MLQTFKLLFLCFALSGSSLAIGETTCSNINGKDANKPLSVDNGIFCFKLQPAQDHNGNILPGAEPEIRIYFIKSGRRVLEIKDWAVPGIINDAFNIDVNKDGKRDVIVISSNEIRTYTGTCLVSPWYSVSVFTQNVSGFEYDRRATEWVGWGGDLTKVQELCDENELIYVYPYKTKEAVEKALSSSPFVSLLENNTALPATVVRKSWLYESSTVATQTKKYLIAGDKVMVDEVTASFCEITYTGGKKPLQMWMKCSDLSLESFNK